MDQQRLPSPGPSFIRGGAGPTGGSAAEAGEVVVGLTAPSVMDDGWWLTHLWAQDAGGVVSARVTRQHLRGGSLALPLLSIGPVLAGALAGFIDQEDGRQLIRLRMPPAADEARPWSAHCC
ncbi:MAG: hypothetical protein R3C32_11430 [Chloroflexota bacterium]